MERRFSKEVFNFKFKIVQLKNKFNILIIFIIYLQNDIPLVYT